MAKITVSYDAYIEIMDVLRKAHTKQIDSINPDKFDVTNCADRARFEYEMGRAAGIRETWELLTVVLSIK